MYLCWFNIERWYIMVVLVHIQYNETPLHKAAAKGRTDVVMYLLDNTSTDVNVLDKVSVYNTIATPTLHVSG